MQGIRPSRMPTAALLLAGVTLGGAMVATGGPGAMAQAQQWTGSSSVEDLRYRLDVLDAELADLRARLGGTPGVPVTGGAAAVLSNSAVNELEGEVRRLTAAVEELRYRQSRIAEEAARRFSDIEFRLTELEGGDVSNLQPVPPLGGIAEPQAPAPEPAPAPAPTVSGSAEPAGTGATVFGTGAAPAPTPNRTPLPANRPATGTGGTGQAGGIVAGPAGQGSFAGVEVPYTAPGEQVAVAPVPQQGDLEAAVTDVRQGRFDQAEKRLRDFLEQNPDGPMAAEAWYWLGESQFARGNQAEAARSYLHGYRTDETGPRAAQNLYRLGVVLGRLGQISEACLTLRQVRQFRGAPNDLVGKADAEADSLACG